jgi:hypothetical protein
MSPPEGMQGDLFLRTIRTGPVLLRLSRIREERDGEGIEGLQRQLGDGDIVKGR